MFMKTFEERYTAWIDGQLAGVELEQFERALPDRAEAEADRVSAQGLARVLRSHGAAPPLTNSDFFSHQFAARLAAEERKAVRPARASGFGWAGFLTLGNLAWGGVCCLLVTAGLYFAVIAPARPGGGSLVATNLPISAVHVAAAAPGSPANAEPSVYDASIIEAKPGQPGVSATSVSSKSGDMTVLWLDGLDYLPASYQLQ